MPNAKWYAENYSPGDCIVVVFSGVVQGVDPGDDEQAVELNYHGQPGNSWLTTDRGALPIKGADNYDKLVDLLDMDELLAAIERKVGTDQVEKEPEYRTGGHWCSIRPGDSVRVPLRAGGYELVEVQAVEEPQYEGELVLCVSGCAGTYWLGDNDPVCPYAWPEGISYDD